MLSLSGFCKSKELWSVGCGLWDGMVAISGPLEVLTMSNMFEFLSMSD